MVGGDGRIVEAHDVEAHDKAVGNTLAWLKNHTAQTRVQDKAMHSMIRVGGQKMVEAIFRYDTSRNFDLQLHTHRVIANMVLGADASGERRTLPRENGDWRDLPRRTGRGIEGILYGIEKTHTDGRFEIAAVPRDVIEAFSMRRAEIEAAMAGAALARRPRTFISGRRGG